MARAAWIDARAVADSESPKSDEEQRRPAIAGVLSDYPVAGDHRRVDQIGQSADECEVAAGGKVAGDVPEASRSAKAIEAGRRAGSRT